MAPRRKATGSRQLHASNSKQPAEQPEWLKQKLCIVQQYRSAQKQMLAEMRACRVPKPKKERRKRKKQILCIDLTIRRSKRPRQMSKRVGSPFVVPDYRKKRTLKVEEDSTHMNIVKQESHIPPNPTMQIQQNAAGSGNFDNANPQPPKHSENAERRTQQNVSMQHATLRRSRRQRQQPPYNAGTIRQKRKRRTICRADNVESAVSPLAPILSFLHIETDATNESGTQTSPSLLKLLQVEASTNVSPPPCNIMNASCQTEIFSDAHKMVENGTQTEANTNTSTETATQTQHHEQQNLQHIMIRAPPNQQRKASPTHVSTADVVPELRTSKEADASRVTSVPPVQPIDVITIDDDDDDDPVEIPTLRHAEERRVVRFTKCTTATPELRIQCRDNPNLEHVYSLKSSHWFADAHQFCMGCSGNNDQAFVRLKTVNPESGEFVIFKGGQHDTDCAQPFQPNISCDSIRVYDNRLFVKAEKYLFSEDRSKLVILRKNANIEFTVQNSYATYNKYTSSCACVTPAIVTRSSVWVNYGHGVDCPVQHRFEAGNRNVGVSDTTRLALKEKISGRSKVIRVIRPKRNFPGRRRLSATIDEVIENVIHPPAKDTDKGPSVETFEVKEPETQPTMATANPGPCPMTIADVRSFDFSPLGSNLSIASSFADSGVFSMGQMSHRASLDSVNTAGLRRASDPAVVNGASDVFNPMDWLKHRLSLPLDNHVGTTVNDATLNPIVSERRASEPTPHTFASLFSLFRETAGASTFGTLFYYPF